MVFCHVKKKLESTSSEALSVSVTLQKFSGQNVDSNTN